MAKVLIIEDDEVIARGMARHLETAGFDAVGVANGETGLARLRYERPDVCVLDLMLPGIDGWRVIEQARDEGIGTPIVVVSARGTEHDRVHALEIGDRGAPPKTVASALGYRLAGASVGGGAVVLFAADPAVPDAEVTLPDVPTRRLILAGLEPGAAYALQFTSSYAPGAPEWTLSARANDSGVLEAAWDQQKGRLRLKRLATAGR